MREGGTIISPLVTPPPHLDEYAHGCQVLPEGVAGLQQGGPVRVGPAGGGGARGALGGRGQGEAPHAAPELTQLLHHGLHGDGGGAGEPLLLMGGDKTGGA